MTLSFKPLASLVCGALLFSTAPTFGQSADDIRATAEEALSAFNIPGLAVVAVKDGEVILAEGFGVRDVGNGEPVNADTLFGVASHTKAFTAAALATLVEQKKLRWDDKVIQYIPEFRLSDPAITAELTIRDLLSHRSGLGLGAGDLMIWPNTDKSTAEILAGLAHVPFASGLRERFAYNNLMFVTAGEVIGITCHSACRRKIFQIVQWETMQLAIHFNSADCHIINVTWNVGMANHRVIHTQRLK